MLTSLPKKARFALGFILFMIIVSWSLPWILPLDPYTSHDNLLSSPSLSSEYYLGTDDLGRDVLARLIYGARNTLTAGMIVVFISLIIGGATGFLASVYGGFFKWSTSGFADLILSFPSILLTIVLLTMWGPGMTTTVFAVTIVTIPGFIRIVKSTADDELKKDYIRVAQSFGCTRFQILRSELLPNCLSPIIVQTTFAFSEAILAISALGFLRIGISPPMAEWGSMLADAWQFMESQPSLVIFPGFCLFSTVFATNLLGDQCISSMKKVDTS